MKLFELNRGDHFKLLKPATVPPDAPFGSQDVTYRLTTIDGMYSHCTDTNNDVYHFAAWSDVEKV